MAAPSKNSIAHNELDLRPRITVIGVGGAGGNAVNNMIRAKLEGVEFVVGNTDAQALSHSLVENERRIQLGLQVSQGLGAGSKPDVGRAAAEESIDTIISNIQGSNMVFITAGMGGGTGTGSAPVIARAAREAGILTVGVVSKPFHFEGTHRMRTAERGIEELQQYVDTLIIIPNQNLFRIANERTTFADAFKLADDVLYSGVRGVTDLMMMPGLINLDFADIRAVMAEMGKAMMGTGEAEGERRALDAAEAAISNPLLDDVSMKGAKGVLINITGGYDMTLYEVDEAANRIREDVDPNANIIFGSTFDEKLNGRIRVSVVATGIGPVSQQQHSATSHTSSGASSHGTSARFDDHRAQNPSPVVEKPTTVFDIKATPSFEPKEQYKQDTSFESQHASTSVSDHSSFDDTFNPMPKQPSQKDDLSALRSINEEELRQQFESPTPVERKRPSSLFERFTGARQKQTSPEAHTSNSTEQASSSDSELLEIPAFLRRGG